MKTIVPFVILSFVFLFHAGSKSGPLTVAHAEQKQEWKQEFAEVCSKTQNAMLLSIAELQDVVKRCDGLQERLEELNGQEGKTERKVYTKRLKMCRDLYQFTLDFKKREE
jgi:hypothetical protein